MHPHCGNKKAKQQRHLRQSSKNRRKINSTEIMNRLLLWPVGVGHSWDDPSKCVEATNTTLFGHLFKAKKGPSMHILYICQNRTKVRKFKKLLLRGHNKAKPYSKSCNPMMDSDTLTKGGKCLQSISKYHMASPHAIQKPGLFWEISQKKGAGDFTLRTHWTVIAVTISNNSVELSGSVNFFGP